MPTNVGPEYLAAEAKYREAKTIEEKISALKLMLATVPKHKGTEKLQVQLKKRLAKLKENLEKSKTKGKKSFTIKKEGAATIGFISALGTLKSKIFAKLANSSYNGENNYGFQMKMISFENIWLQGIDFPAIYFNFHESSLAGQTFSLLQICDVLVLIADSEKELDLIKQELNYCKNLPVLITISSDVDLENLKKMIWSKCNKIRILTKTSGKIAEKPIVLKNGSKIKDLAKEIHQDFIRKFKYAKIWGPSAKFPGQSVGLEHELKDTDIVEIYTT
ncbi:MAG: TGS domain-containing protein [Candidatus Nanoarchaeia archaeon]